MSILSTEGPASSRTFDARTMKAALKKMSPDERSDVYALVTVIDEQTSMGYYAAMDFVANLGLFFSNLSTKSS